MLPGLVAGLVSLGVFASVRSLPRPIHSRAPGISWPALRSCCCKRKPCAVAWTDGTAVRGRSVVDGSAAGIWPPEKPMSED